MADRLSVPLSVLDLCPVPVGASIGDVIRRSVDLARHVEAWGYRRYWVAEHHNVPGIASAAPAVLVGQLAAATSSIRVGSGGVMLGNHPPLTIAEQFGTLEAAHPGRIDLGIGRAPGTDQATARALRRTVDAASPGDLAGPVDELQAYFSDPPGGGPTGRIRAIPAEGNRPLIWLLGSAGYSAELAGRLGLPFACAHHLSPHNTRPALALYRKTFRPSDVLAEPYCLISVATLCAADEAQARWLHRPTGSSLLRLRTERDSTLPSPEAAFAYPYSAAEETAIAELTAAHVVGGPAAVLEQLERLVAETGADELMLTTSTFAHADRLASYQLIAASAADPAISTSR